MTRHHRSRGDHGRPPDDLRREALRRLEHELGEAGRETPQSVQTLLHELEVHQVELEIQNEDLKQAQADLTAAHDRYRDLYENAPVGYLMIDRLGVIERANRCAGRMCGQEPGQLVGRRLEELLEPGCRDSCYLLLRRAAAAGPDHPGEMRLDRAAGDGGWVNLEATPLRDGQGELSGFRVTLSDIEERKQAEGSLRSLQRTLEERVASRTAEFEAATRLLREMVVAVSRTEDRERQRLADLLHEELQQVVVAALYWLNRIAQGAAGPGQSRDLERVRELLVQVNDLSRKLANDLSPPLLRQQGLLPALRWLGQELEKTRGLAVEVRARGEEFSLSADLTLLAYRGAQELLVNVANHAGVDRARITVAPEGRELTITVDDEGRGFESRSLSLTDSATGFGLRRLHERLDAMGGRLDLDTAPGKGCRTRMVLPPATTPAITPAAGDSPAAPGDPGSRTLEADRSVESAVDDPAGTRPIRVLIVDDHAVVRDGLSMLMSEEPDLTVVGMAASGTEAESLAVAHEPDVVLMDYSLPGANGDQVTRRLLAGHPGMCVIGLSMFQDPEIAQLMLAAGAEAFVTKSGAIEEIIATVRRLAGPASGT